MGSANMPTALELTPEQLERYKRTARRRLTSSTLSKGDEAKRKALLERASEAAELLKKQYNARRVILFGSLAHRAWFTPDTDVDLAVEGLKGNYWQAWRQVEEIFEDRQVDLVEIESVSDSLRQAIHDDGIEL